MTSPQIVKHSYVPCGTFAFVPAQSTIALLGAEEQFGRPLYIFITTVFSPPNEYEYVCD